ncbi:MAG: GNVR domain-containing protein, partial [Algoriphagus sp.]
MYPNTPNPSNSGQNPFMVQKEDEIDLKVLLFNYLQYWVLILACMFIGVLGAFLFNRYATNVFKVESSILVVDDKPSLGTDLFESSGLGMLQGKSNIENEIGILKSFSLAEEAVTDLNLNVQYYKEGFVSTTQIYDKLPVMVAVNWKETQLVGGKFRIEVIDEDSFELSVENDEFRIFNPKDPYYKTLPEASLSLPKSIYSFGQEVKGENFSFTINQIASLSGDVILFNLVDTPSLALKYKEELAVSPINKQASILTLSLETPVRRLGEDYINKIMEVYLARELDEKNRASENTVKFINEQLSGISDSLRFSENKLQEYRTENKVFNLSEEGAVIFERLQELEKEKGQAEINLKYYQTLRDYLLSDQRGEMMAPSVVGVTDPLLNSLVQAYSELQAQQERLSANFTELDPSVRENATRIQSTKRQLQENVNSALANTNNLISDLNGQIRMLDIDINSLPETERNLISIQRQFTINENIYIYLLQKKAEAEITKAANMPKNSVLDFAKASQTPVAPKRSLNLLIGLILGLILPIGFITIKDFLNTKIEDPKELENQIKVPLIGMIGRNNSEDAIPVLNNPRSTVTESFRSLRADMTYLSPNREKLTILFTSSISGEGKTFVSINVASVYALMGKKTILIGLDLRKPKIAEDFGLANDKGMSTCLSTDTP